MKQKSLGLNILRVCYMYIYIYPFPIGSMYELFTCMKGEKWPHGSTGKLLGKYTVRPMDPTGLVVF